MITSPPTVPLSVRIAVATVLTLGLWAVMVVLIAINRRPTVMTVLHLFINAVATNCGCLALSANAPATGIFLVTWAMIDFTWRLLRHIREPGP